MNYEAALRGTRGFYAPQQMTSLTQYLKCE
jgi:hypothetical protein